MVRVFGLAMSRIADAVISSFLVNVAPAAQREDPVGFGVARANVEAASLLPLVAPALDTLLRQHLLIARRLTTVGRRRDRIRDPPARRGLRRSGRLDRAR